MWWHIAHKIGGYFMLRCDITLIEGEAALRQSLNI